MDGKSLLLTLFSSQEPCFGKKKVRSIQFLKGEANCLQILYATTWGKVSSFRPEAQNQSPAPVFGVSFCCPGLRSCMLLVQGPILRLPAQSMHHLNRPDIFHGCGPLETWKLLRSVLRG